jgi:hypothetical protein
MKKWSDLWESPKNVLIAIIVLLVIYGVFNLDKVIFLFDTILAILLNKILPIVIVIAIFIFLLRWAKGK